MQKKPSRTRDTGTEKESGTANVPAKGRSATENEASKLEGGASRTGKPYGESVRKANRPPARQHSVWCALSDEFRSVLVCVRHPDGADAASQDAPRARNDGLGITVVDSRSAAELVFYDPDGYICNRVSIAFRAPVTVLEVEEFLPGCKYEGGIRHCQVMLTESVGLDVSVRFVSRESSGLHVEPAASNRAVGGFAPFVVGPTRFNLLSVVNRRPVDGVLRFRVSCGDRNLEDRVEVPAFGSRLLDIAPIAAPLIGEHGERDASGYVRYGCSQGQEFGVQLIEGRYSRESMVHSTTELTQGHYTTEPRATVARPSSLAGARDASAAGTPHVPLQTAIHPALGAQRPAVLQAHSARLQAHSARTQVHPAPAGQSHAARPEQSPMARPEQSQVARTEQGTDTAAAEGALFLGSVG